MTVAIAFKYNARLKSGALRRGLGIRETLSPT
jgi:hypothetical protein